MTTLIILLLLWWLFGWKITLGIFLAIALFNHLRS